MLDSEKTVETHPFKVKLSPKLGNRTRKFPKTEELAYGWKIGLAGELTIYKVEYHPDFSAIIRDGRHRCYAPGTWEWVLVEDED